MRVPQFLPDGQHLGKSGKAVQGLPFMILETRVSLQVIWKPPGFSWKGGFPNRFIRKYAAVFSFAFRRRLTEAPHEPESSILMKKEVGFCWKKLSTSKSAHSFNSRHISLKRAPAPRPAITAYVCLSLSNPPVLPFLPQQLKQEYPGRPPTPSRAVNCGRYAPY